MIRRRRLGQHYLIDRSVMREIVRLAEIKPGDRVFEIGSGKGDLTLELAKAADHVDSFEVDDWNYQTARGKLASCPNVSIFNQDAFESDSEFDVLVSSLPYSESSRFVEWLSCRAYRRAVVIVQRDFADKLLSSPGDHVYRAISVISQVSSNLKVQRKIPREFFSPVPKVESVIATMTPKVGLDEVDVRMIKRIFSMRRKKLASALKKLGVRASSVPNAILECRVDSIDPETMYQIVRSIRSPQSARIG